MTSAVESQSNIKIRQIEFRTLVHATESTEKVVNVLLNLVSDEISEKNLEIEILKGTFGQKITNIAFLILLFPFKNTLNRIIEAGTKITNIYQGEGFPPMQ